jgi:hypothetical protein
VNGVGFRSDAGLRHLTCPEDQIKAIEPVNMEHARHAVHVGDFEWACFAAQQATEAERAIDHAEQILHFCEGHLL